MNGHAVEFEVAAKADLGKAQRRAIEQLIEALPKAYPPVEHHPYLPDCPVTANVVTWAEITRSKLDRNVVYLSARVGTNELLLGPPVLDNAYLFVVGPKGAVRQLFGGHTLAKRRKA